MFDVRRPCAIDAHPSSCGRRVAARERGTAHAGRWTRTTGIVNPSAAAHAHCVTKISCSDQVHDASHRYDRNGSGPCPFLPTQRVAAARHDHALGPDSSSAGPFFYACPTITAGNCAAGTRTDAFSRTGSDCRTGARHSRPARQASGRSARACARRQKRWPWRRNVSMRSPRTTGRSGLRSRQGK